MGSPLITLSYTTEIIIEIKQFNPGQIAFNPFIASNRRYMLYPLSDNFSHRKWPFRLKNEVNGREIIDNKCTHCAIQLLLIGKHAHRKEILDMLDLDRKAIASNFSCIFTSKIRKSQRISVPTAQ